MSYDEDLAGRVAGLLKRKKGVTEKRMFGGVAFLLGGKMFCGVEKENLVVRVGPEKYDEFLSKRHVRPMDFTGRSLRGFIYVSPRGLRSGKSLKSWVEKGLAFAGSLTPK